MENLGIDTKLLLAQLVNFILFFVLFKKFIAKPFLTFLKSEEDKEKEKQKMTEKIMNQQNEFDEKEKEFKAKMKKNMDEELKMVKEKAQHVKAEMLDEAKAEADEIVLKAKKQMAEEQKTLEKDTKNKVADLSVYIVQKALKDYLPADAKQKVTSAILKNLNKDVLKYEN